MTTASIPVRQAPWPEYAADFLRTFAGNWDSHLFTFDKHHPADCILEQRNGRGFCEGIFINGLITTAMEYADPSLTRDDVYSYMTDLRDAVNALNRFLCGEGWDGDEHDEKRHYSDETVQSVLEDDIDGALWPLLTGMAYVNACFGCRRFRSSVTHWKAREAGSSRCAECQAAGR